MAETLGTVASIIQLVDIALKARDYIQDFCNAPQEQQKLLKEMDDLRPLLAELRSQMAPNPPSSILQQMESPLTEFKATMEQFTAELRGGDGPFTKVSKRLTWTMWRKKEAKEYLGKFEQFKSLLNSWLLLDIWDIGRRHLQGHDSILRSVDNVASLVGLHQQSVIKMSQQMNSGEREKIIHWLSPLNFFLRQADVSHTRQPGTGEWLLEDPRFRKWVSNSGQTLWCYGIPGAGKTVLASLVVDHLGARSQNENIGVASIYLDHKEADAHPPAKLLAGAWRQLVLGRDITSEVRKLYHQHLEKATTPSVDEIHTVLCSAAAEFTKVYIVVDAVDEYSDDRRGILLGRLAAMGPCVNLMVTARPHILPNPCFPKIQSLEIRANEGDIQRYVDSQIQTSLRLSKHVRTQPDLREEIHSKIRRTVDGMFLLAKLHIESLTKKSTVKAVRDALKDLPRNLHETYESAMSRIKDQIEEDWNIAHSVLTWVANAKRPLSVLELQVALAIDSDLQQLDGDNILDIDIILSVCAGLVIVDEQLSVVRLVHHTTQEFLDSVQEQEFPDAQTDITRSLLTFLAIHDRSFKSLPYFTEALQDYCQYCFMHAAGKPERELQNMIVEFLGQAAEHRKSHRKRWRFTPPWDFPNWPAQPPALWIAAAANLVHTTYFLLEMGMSAQQSDDTANSALQVASYYRHLQMVQILLDNGVNRNAQGGFYGSALQAAAYKGHREIVLLLIESGADINIMGGVLGNALQAASSEGHEEIVHILLKSGADINALGGWYNTSLQAASFHGHVNIAQVLLENGANVHALGGEYGSALVIASSMGHAPIVELLVANGADVHAQDEKIGTALHAAAYGGQADIVHLLIRKGADVNGRAGEFGRPIQAAKWKGHYDIARILTKNGAEFTQGAKDT
ncbi:hypothetical protein B0H19DRAFT_1257672 [Mycena capillaripes]|nr:hypothetical protein B0H19DRAFT_1257672 [Mycena capillaripes]